MTEANDTPSPWPSHQHYPRGLEPLPFAAPSLARREQEAEVDAEIEAEAEPELEPERELQLETVAADVAPESRADWQTAPLDGLGLVQLVQRLGATIERRRELLASTAAQPAPPPPAFTEADLEPAAPEDAVQAMAAFFGSAPAEQPEPEAAAEPTPAPLPEFFRSLPLADEDDSEDAIPDFSLPLRRTAAPADNDAADIEAEEESEEGFTSLLAMNNPFAASRSEFVRVEKPEEDTALAEPAVVFPGQDGPAHGSRLFDPPGKAGAPSAAAPQVPADADAALRAALATLQRMSGAA